MTTEYRSPAEFHTLNTHTPKETMKLAILFCVSVLFYLSAAEPEPREANCDPESTGVCTREYNPVCGDDNITYPTECILCMENKQRNQKIKIKYQGECKPLEPNDVPIQ